MPTINVIEQSDHLPEQVLDAARDFSERRAELWPDVHLKHYQVHQEERTPSPTYAISLPFSDQAV